MIIKENNPRQAIMTSYNRPVLYNNIVLYKGSRLTWFLCGAKRLVLNHFSPRYKGDQALESISIMTRIERQAIKASSLPVESVAASIPG